MMEKDLFIENKNCEEKVPPLNKSSSTPSMTPSVTQMYSQQLEQQRNAQKYHGPYRTQAREIQYAMDKVLHDVSLPEDIKS